MKFLQRKRITNWVKTEDRYENGIKFCSREEIDISFGRILLVSFDKKPKLKLQDISVDREILNGNFYVTVVKILIPVK